MAVVKSAEHAAASCGRVRGNKARGVNVKDGAWTDATVAELRRHWDDGLSMSEIARRLGVSKNSISGKVRRLDLPDRGSPIVFAPPSVGAAPKRKDEPAREKAKPLGSGRGCQWIDGQPAGKDTVFCGEPCKPGSPYCPSHHRRAYTPIRKRDTTVRPAA